jgi:hypothetical protein
MASCSDVTGEANRSKSKRLSREAREPTSESWTLGRKCSSEFLRQLSASRVRTASLRTPAHFRVLGFLRVSAIDSNKLTSSGTDLIPIVRIGSLRPLTGEITATQLPVKIMMLESPQLAPLDEVCAPANPLENNKKIAPIARFGADTIRQDTNGRGVNLRSATVVPLSFKPARSLPETKNVHRFFSNRA